MNKELIIECYMMLEKKTLAELLYDTITKYENKLKELEKQSD